MKEEILELLNRTFECGCGDIRPLGEFCHRCGCCEIGCCMCVTAPQRKAEVEKRIARLLEHVKLLQDQLKWCEESAKIPF